MLVQMELARIIISELNDQQVVYCGEIEGPRSFPILIGNLRGDQHQPAREGGGLAASPDSRLLERDRAARRRGAGHRDHNLLEHTYYAVIRIRKDGELVEVDSRPSDAIALAVQFKPPLPIYVDDSVLEEVA